MTDFDVNVSDLERQFSLNPGEGRWVEVSTQDAHWLSLPLDCQGMLDKILGFATGMAGILMGIDPFNQPGVEAGKQVTREIKAKIEEIVNSGTPLVEAYQEVVRSYQSPHRIEIADGIYLDYGELMEVAGVGFTRFLKEKERKLEGLSASELYSLILEFAKSRGKSYGAILPYAQETPERAKVWAKARGILRKFGLQDVFGIGPVYEYSLRQFLQQGPDLGIPTFIVVNDIGSQIIPGDRIEGFTTGMQNVLQALGTQKALAEAGRYTIRIEIEALKVFSLEFLPLEVSSASIVGMKFNFLFFP